MQMHTDSKRKVALDDITLWANRYTKCNGNTISRFHFDSALYKWGDFHMELYSMTPAAFRHNF